MDFSEDNDLEFFEGPDYPLRDEWYHDIMYFLLKRFKGAISYTEFYEMWDDDLWALYRMETKLVEEELKDTPQGNDNKNTLPEPVVAEESQEAKDVMYDIRGE